MSLVHQYAAKGDYSNLEKENAKILELCGKDKERVQKKNKTSIH